MSDELETSGEGLLERGFASAWERLAPLSAGAVASGVVLVGGSFMLRRLLGSRRGILSWTATAVLLPVGLWLMAGAKEEDSTPRSRGDVPELDERETTIIPEA